MSDDPWNDPQAQDWLHYVRTHVLPMVEDANVVISLCPPREKVDVKFAVELGMSIMLDKPIVVVATSDEDVPDKLRTVADQIFVGDITTPRGRAGFLSFLEEWKT